MPDPAPRGIFAEEFFRTALRFEILPRLEKPQPAKQVSPVEPQNPARYLERDEDQEQGDDEK